VHLPAPLIRTGLRLSRPVFASPRLPITRKRRAVDALAAAGRAPRSATYREDRIAAVEVQVVTAGSTTRGTLLYLHGGGYALGSARGYRGFVAHLAAASGMTAVIPEYSRSPEHPYPAALDEAAAVFEALVADPARGPVVVAGDSAGGGLALALAMRARDTGRPSPAALGLICPWLDLAADVAGSRADRRDPLIVPAMLGGWARAYTGDGEVTDPLISPTGGDLGGLPPILVQTAADDPIAADAEALHRRIIATADAGAFDHRVWPDRWHCFHLQAGMLRDADEAVAALGAGLATHAFDHASDRASVEPA
jgi:epsilon-lactone hydrolase